MVVPTHNRAHLLGPTLRCILAQRDVTLEVIVVDDGSRDATAEVVEGLADERIRLLRHDSPRGVAQARNTGIAAATHPWVAFCDDDDLWSPTKLARQLAAIRATGGSARWSATSAAVADDAGTLLNVRWVPAERDVATRLLAGNAIPGGGSAVLAETQLVRTVGSFDPTLSMLADWDLWVRLALAAPFAPVTELCLVNVRHDGNMSWLAAQALHELDRMGVKYAAERQAMGVGAHDIGMQRWTVWSVARSGRRWEAARGYARLAVRQRSPGMLLRAAFATLGGDAIEWRVRTKVRRLPAEVRAEAEALIREVRAIADEPERSPR